MKFLFFKGAYSGMKKFGSNVVEVTNCVLLIPVYFLGVGISSIILKISGKKMLNMRKPDKKIKTYWMDKEKNKLRIENFYRQF